MLTCPHCDKPVTPDDNQVAVAAIGDGYAVASLYCPGCARPALVALVPPKLWQPITGPDSRLVYDSDPVCQAERCRARHDLVRCWNEKTAVQDVGNIYCRQHAAENNFCPDCGRSLSGDYGDGPPASCACRAGAAVASS